MYVKEYVLAPMTSGMSEIQDDHNDEQPMHSSQKNGKKKKSPGSSRFQFQSISDSEEETYDPVNGHRMSKQVY